MKTILESQILKLLHKWKLEAKENLDDPAAALPLETIEFKNISILEQSREKINIKFLITFFKIFLWKLKKNIDLLPHTKSIKTNYEMQCHHQPKTRWNVKVSFPDVLYLA